MVEKIDIEKYCNRYEELYRLVCFLEQQCLTNDEMTLLKAKVDQVLTDISKLHSKQSECVALTDEEKTKFGITQEEITSLQSKAEHMKIDMNEMLYFLVCAKIPFYSSRVARNLKHSFVNASFSLYYSNWFYVFSSLSKLFELYSHSVSVTGAKTDYQSFVLSLIDAIRPSVVRDLLTLLKSDLLLLRKGPIEFAGLIEKETAITCQSLFFLFSASPITPEEFKEIVSLYSTSLDKCSSFQRTRKNDPYRMDSLFYIASLLAFILLIAILRIPDSSTALRTSLRTSFGMDSIKTALGVPQLVIGVFGLQWTNEEKEIQELRKLLRSALRNKAISLVYRHLISAQQHCEDRNLCDIFIRVCYELLYTYLLVQASQWHTIHSKQFAYYESLDGGKTEDEDGLETLVYLFEYLFTHLRGIHVPLSPFSVDETPFIYFCTMLSDRLRAEPYLFNSYLHLLTAIASTSPSSAEAVYQLIDSTPSEHVSWGIMTNALSECQALVERDGGRRALVDTDVTGFCAMIGLMTAVLQNTSKCPAVLHSLQGNSIHLCIRLLYQPVHVTLKTQLVRFLTCVAGNPAYAKLVWKQFEVGHVIDVQNGILFELENVENSLQAFSLTRHFLRLLIKIARVLGGVSVVESPVFQPILEFVINRVLLQAEFRNYLPHRNGEKWKLAKEVLEFLGIVIEAFLAKQSQWDQMDNRDNADNKDLKGGHLQTGGRDMYGTNETAEIQGIQEMQGIQRIQGNRGNQGNSGNPGSPKMQEGVRDHLGISDPYHLGPSGKQSKEGELDALQQEKNQFYALISSILTNAPLIQKLFRFLDLVPTHSLLDVNSLPTDCITESSLYVDCSLFDAYPAQRDLLETAVIFLSDMLQITTETINRLGLHVTTFPANFVSSLASQFLTDSHAILALFLCLSSENQPFLQKNTLKAIRLLCDQIRPDLLLSLLESHPFEMEKIRTSLVTILRKVSLSASEGANVETCNEFFSLCEAYAKDAFPSITTVLLGIPQVFQQNSRNSDNNVFVTLLDFLNNTSLVASHVTLASHAMQVLFMLCSHHEKTVVPRLCKALIDAQTGQSLLSLFPALLRQASQNGGNKETSVSSVSSFPAKLEEFVALHVLIGMTMKLLCILLHHQKQWGLSLQLIGSSLEACLVYNKSVCDWLHQTIPSTSPLLDCLQTVDQSYIDPTNMPSYLNDCTYGTWIQRDCGGITFVQVDLLRLAGNIQEQALTQGCPAEQIQDFVEEGTQWTRIWNYHMSLEAAKSLVFSASCQYLHFALIETRETISLIPRFSDSPFTLHMAVLHALLDLMMHVTSFERPYLKTLASLLFDVLRILRTAPTSLFPPFSQQTVITSLLQILLSPAIQQRHDPRSMSSRTPLYLCLLNMLEITHDSIITNSSLSEAMKLLSGSLVEDLMEGNIDERIVVLSLSEWLLHSPLQEVILDTFLRRDDILCNCLHWLDAVDTAVLRDDPIQHSCRMMCDSRGYLTHRIIRFISFLRAIATPIQGAMKLLDWNIFPLLAECPLLQLGAPAGFPVYPNKLSSLQRDGLRQVLRPMFQLVLLVVQTVRSFRGVRDEVLRFVRATVNVSLIILEDRQGDEMMALEVLALYQAVLALLACDAKEMGEDLGGFEKVIAEKMKENLKEVEKRGVGKKEGTEKEIMWRRVVESSIVFLHALGEEIPEKLMKGLEAE